MEHRIGMEIRVLSKYMGRYLDDIHGIDCMLSGPQGLILIYLCENDEEVYPDFVQKENLELLYYGEQFEDILLNVVDQIGIPSEKDYIEALIFFMENDEFKDF